MKNLTRRAGLAVTLLAVLAATAGQARAGIVAATGASILYADSQVTFTDSSDNTIGTYPGQGISTELQSLNSTVTLTYDQTFDYYGNGLRVSELIANNTGGALSSLTITLGGPSGVFFNDNYSPALVSINAASDPKEVHVIREFSNGGITLGPDKRSVTFSFLTPIANGATFGVHIPVQGLDGSGGTYTLTHTATIATPEPSTLVSGAMAAMVGIGYGRRRRSAKLAA